MVSGPIHPICATDFNVEEREYVDIDEQAARLHGYDQQYLQLSAGKYSGIFCAIESSSGFSIYIEETNQFLAQQGVVPPDSFALGILMDSPQPCMFDGSELEPNEMFLIHPEAEYDFNSVPGMQICIVNIPAERLIQDTPQSVPRLGKIEGDPRIIEGISIFIKASVQRFRADPALLSNPGVAEGFQNSVTSMLSWCLTLSMEIKPNGFPNVRKNNLSLYRNTRDLMYNSIDCNTSLMDICRTLDVSRRTLEYCFADVCGVSPARYFKTIRLNEVRRQLKSPNANADTIGDIAARMNFWNLGRLAGEYSELYGEKPSKTRKSGV